MTVVNSARRGAWRTMTSGPLEMLIRTGFVGYGLLHIAVGWLAVEIALGRSHEEGSQSGAFQTLAGRSAGSC